MSNKSHPFHMVEMSPWPILASMAVFSAMSSTIIWTQLKSSNTMLLSVATINLIAYMWWRDITREAKNQGFHQLKVIDGIKMGMLLFITSEIFFFLSFFWTYFHSSASPNMEIGQNWPPVSISPFNPMNVPLLNTIILLSSGVSITWSHHSILNNMLKKTSNSLKLTVVLGIYFSMLQAMEYWQAEFSISDSIYGSIFFMSTGFHGIHVIIGTMFLAVCMIRIMNMQMNKNHLMGFEAAAWYWHFVDVVWIFLYTAVYWWGA